jgi:AcrR family transcriptional regulator
MPGPFLDPSGTPPAQPLRADAQRNRDAILAAAREIFETEGVLAPLDGIAVRAGVGNATLYRNFPTRDDLLGAVMQTNIADALSAAQELARSLDPPAALSEWLVQLTWQLRIWHDLPYCLAKARPDSATATATSSLLAETANLLHAAQVAGAVIDNISGEEVYELITTISWGVDRYGDDETAARRRVKLATAGLFS